MFGGTALTHEAKRIARYVDAVYGESDQQRFVLGTCTPSVKKQNQLQLLDANLSLLRTYDHDAPIDHFAMCPLAQQHDKIVTASISQQQESSFAVWKMQHLEDTSNGSSSDNASLELLNRVTCPTRVIRSIWNPTEETNGAVLATLNTSSLSTWTLVDGAGSIQIYFITVDESIQTWDIRSNKVAYKIDKAHLECARDIDYNPNKPYYIASGGNDGKMKFWDVRKSSHAILSIQSHSHWAWCVKYNRFHDQLVLSSGSDSVVNLWRISSISSAPILEMDEGGESGIDIGDAKIKSFEEHEDSVYSVAWGSVDSWVFVSVSYDGRVVLNHVPSTEKYRILL
ncbi:hypothetical protein Ae201684P_019632 [Aphanomyces euteiches]|nr:hypothetical protein Ae201684P_019632 [Aphanomyces euteiches]